MLRRLAEKKFVLCPVVLKNNKHIVDRCTVGHSAFRRIPQRVL